LSKTDDRRAPRAQRIAEAAAERDAGMAKAEATADPRVILAIDAAIQRAIDSGRRFSANDIRDQFPVSNEGLVGDRFNSFVKRRVEGRRLMVAVGRTTSTLKSTHHHEIKVWLGYDAWQALHRNNRQEQPA
jgi:hypothetical protein